MKVTFDLEGGDTGAALFALYAGLRMYHDLKTAQPKDANAFSISAAEAYCMLQAIKEQHPKEFAECVAEYNEVYGSKKIFSDEVLSVNDSITGK